MSKDGLTTKNGTTTPGLEELAAIGSVEDIQRDCSLLNELPQVLRQPGSVFVGWTAVIWGETPGP
jgi:hypothetical protein